MGQTGLWSSIKPDLEKDVKRICKLAAKDVTQQLTADYQKAINTFYAGYKDGPYRTYASRLATSGIKSPNKYIRVVDLGCMGGIDVDSSYIGSPYRADTSWVFNRVYEQGIHGYTASEAAEWSSRPHNKARGIVFRPTAPPSSPPPSVLMDMMYDMHAGPAALAAAVGKYF